MTRACSLLCVILMSIMILAPSSMVEAGERITVYETVTEEAKSWNSWESKKAACTYAAKRAAQRAKKRCKEDLNGQHTKITPKAKGDKKHRTFLSSCDQSQCQRTKSGKYWHCWAHATIKCKYKTDAADPSLLSKLKGAARVLGDSVEVGQTPCDMDENAIACRDYRKEIKSVGGVKG